MDLLVISLAGIGDTLFATPLVHELRANFPEAKIDALVLWPGSKSLLEGNPHLNQVYQKNLLKATKAQAFSFLWDLRKNRYDISINTHPQSRIQYRMVARLIGASTRISHEYDNLTPLDSLLVNRTLKQDYSRHAIENNLALLSFVRAQPKLPRHDYEIYLSASELDWAEQFVSSNGFADENSSACTLGRAAPKISPSDAGRWNLMSN